MSNEIPCSEADITCFIHLLKNEFPEHRDNRGKRHSLVLVIVAFVLATLAGRQQLSSIHRFMCDHSNWLHELSKTPKAKPISRAQLPRFLDTLHWPELNDLIERHFGVRIYQDKTKCWIAVDGKSLSRALDEGDRQGVVPEVNHDTHEAIAEMQQ